MEGNNTIFWRLLARKIRAQFFIGILVVVPFAITAWILIWLFNQVDGFLQPIIKLVFGRTIPGVGLAVIIVLVYLGGVIATNIVGRTFIHYSQSFMNRVPLVRVIYGGVKQIMEGFSGSAKTGYLQVVLVEYPKKDMWALGFVTHEFSTKSGEKLFNVLIPQPPNPVGGYLQVVKEKDIVRTKISIDDAVKMIISAGSAVPPGFMTYYAEMTGDETPPTKPPESIGPQEW